MEIQGKFKKLITIKYGNDYKKFGLFVNKNQAICDVREILGKTRKGTFIFSTIRPQREEFQYGIRFEVIDPYYHFYGKNKLD